MTTQPATGNERLVAVQIKTSACGKFCGECRHMNIADWGVWCMAFSRGSQQAELLVLDGEEDFGRLPECVASELRKESPCQSNQ